MTNTSAAVESTDQSRATRFAIIAIVATFVITIVISWVAGLVFSNVLDGRPRDRTFWGSLLMAFAPASWVIAWQVVRHRQDYANPRASRRWLAFASRPGTLLIGWTIVFATYGSIDGASARTLIPHTPTLVVEFGAEPRPSFNALGSFGHSDSGWNELRSDGQLTGDIPFRFNAVSSEIEPQQILLAGVVPDAANPRKDVRFDLELRQRTHIRIRGLTNPTILRDGQPCGVNETLGAGKYKITITADR